MTGEELHILRRRARLTQAQFAECLGVSKDLVKSVEAGRRRLTERLDQEIARVFGGAYASVYVMPKSVPVRPAPAPPQRGFLPERFPVVREVSGSGSNRSEDVRVRQVAARPIMAGPLTPDPVPCEWPGCGLGTPPDMFYCAQHMALAQIEGRPTRRVSALADNAASPLLKIRSL